MNKQKAIILLLLLTLCAVLLCGYFLGLSYHKKKNLTIYGNVDVRDVSLSFRVFGRITQMNVDEGDHVKAKALIASLDRDTYLTDLNLAKSELIEAEAAFKNAEIVFKRRSKLVTTGAVSKAQYDDAQANYDENKAKVDTARAKLEKSQISLEDTQLYAPSNGTILTRVREPGSVINAAQPVYTLSVDDPVWIRTYVEEPDLGNIYPGQKAMVYTDSRPKQPYEGHVGYISPQAEFTPKNVETTGLRTDLVYRIRVVVNNPDRGLRQGMPVTVIIQKNHTG